MNVIIASKDSQTRPKFLYVLIVVSICRCGFAQSQEAYDTAVNGLFSTLDMVDDHLGNSRYLCGDTLTLADVCLFTTLIRFDIVYNVLFKCTKKKLIEYPNLHGYMRDIYQVLILALIIYVLLCPYWKIHIEVSIRLMVVDNKRFREPASGRVLQDVVKKQAAGYNDIML